jgi:site-specific DNA-methyltransferase (adenine-specific)
MNGPPPSGQTNPWERIGAGALFAGDVLDGLRAWKGDPFQTIVADPPYFRVLAGTEWDHGWDGEDDYLDWTEAWVRAAAALLAEDGLLYVFGQPGKREHVWLHLCSRLARVLAFHDLLVWDRVVGYNERRDSFTPQFEMILVLRRPGADRVYFDKDAVREPYDEETIRRYARDKRYKDPLAREAHLRKGKFATNIIRVPSLKGSSREKVGHPSQKPLALVDKLVRASSRPGDPVLDPFLGSGTTAVACERKGRRWAGIEKDPAYREMARRRVAACRT